MSVSGRLPLCGSTAQAPRGETPLRWTPLRIPVLLLLALAACVADGPALSFESHLMHDHGDLHGVPSTRHDAEARSGAGEVTVTGRVPVGLCPAVHGEVRLEDRVLSLHVTTRPPNAGTQERCESPHPVAMAEYTARITGVLPGQYHLVVHHEAISPGVDRFDSTRTLTRYSNTEALKTPVLVR